MRYPAGTVLRNADDPNNPVIVTHPDLNWHRNWVKVGVVKYDPAPLRVGDRVEGPTTSRWEIVGLYEGHVWLRQLYRNIEEYDELYVTKLKADVMTWERLPCLPQL